MNYSANPQHINLTLSFKGAKLFIISMIRCY